MVWSLIEITQDKGTEDYIRLQAVLKVREESHEDVRFLKLAKVVELETDNGREFQIFGPKYKIVNCLVFVGQKCGL